MLTVLVVEDEQLVSEYIESCLQGCGYNTIAAPSGEQAIEITGQSTPTLALVDIRLAGKLDGIQTAARLKEKFNIGSVFLTAYSDSATIARAAQVHPLGYLLKPFRDRDLLVSVELAALQMAEGKPQDRNTLLFGYVQELTRRRDRLDDVIAKLSQLNPTGGLDQAPQQPKRGRPRLSAN